MKKSTLGRTIDGPPCARLSRPASNQRDSACNKPAKKKRKRKENNKESCDLLQGFFPFELCLRIWIKATTCIIHFSLPFSFFLCVSVDNERFQRASDHWPRRFRRSLRLPKGRYGQDVCHEMPGQETHQDEARRDTSPQRAHHALPSQHRREYTLCYCVVRLIDKVWRS